MILLTFCFSIIFFFQLKSLTKITIINSFLVRASASKITFASSFTTSGRTFTTKGLPFPVGGWICWPEAGRASGCGPKVCPVWQWTRRPRWPWLCTFLDVGRPSKSAYHVSGWWGSRIRRYRLASGFRIWFWRNWRPQLPPRGLKWERSYHNSSTSSESLSPFLLWEVRYVMGKQVNTFRLVSAWIRSTMSVITVICSNYCNINVSWNGVWLFIFKKRLEDKTRNIPRLGWTIEDWGWHDLRDTHLNHYEVVNQTDIEIPSEHSIIW